MASKPPDRLIKCIIFLTKQNKLDFGWFWVSCLNNNEISKKYLIPTWEEKAIPVTRLWELLYD